MLSRTTEDVFNSTIESKKTEIPDYSECHRSILGNPKLVSVKWKVHMEVFMATGFSGLFCAPFIPKPG